MTLILAQTYQNKNFSLQTSVIGEFDSIASRAYISNIFTLPSRYLATKFQFPDKFEKLHFQEL